MSGTMYFFEGIASALRKGMRLLKTGLIVPRMRKGDHYYLLRWIHPNGEIREAKPRGYAELLAYLEEIEGAGAELLVVCATLEFALEN